MSSTNTAISLLAGGIKNTLFGLAGDDMFLGCTEADSILAGLDDDQIRLETLDNAVGDTANYTLKLHTKNALWTQIAVLFIDSEDGLVIENNRVGASPTVTISADGGRALIHPKRLHTTEIRGSAF